MATWTWRIAAMQFVRATRKRVTYGPVLTKQQRSLTKLWHVGRKCMGRAHKVRTPERELDAALARAKQLESEEIRVARANYEEKTDIISLTLTNGATTSTVSLAPMQR